ncbi:MAG: protein kinase [Deltaproteobacteria bacterium]|nr:protein kinase [Deltaproteobacteria bacterium]
MVGRYRPVRLISQGGFAEVHEAVVEGSQGFSRRVAKKTLLASKISDPSAVASFLDEARITSQLHHANIVATLDFGEEDGRPFQVLELVDGLDLEALLARSGPMGTALACYIAKEVAWALAYAHEARDQSGRSLGIVHRDVSPENVLLSWSGDVKLADFGIALATRREESTRVGIAKGKLDYMSPEQLRAVEVDPRSDLFSLGCVLTQMLTGTSPMSAKEAREQLLKGEPLELTEPIEPDVLRILLRALSPNKQDRPATAQQLAEELSRAFSARSEQDGRAALVSALTPLRPKAEKKKTALDGMFDAGLLDMLAEPQAEGQEPTRSLAPQTEPWRPVSRTEPSSEATDAGELSAPGDSLEGSFVHGYRIESVLGEGATATVYRATHPVLHREIAVKVLHTATPNATRRLRAEAQALARLQHENLVAVVDYGEISDGRPFLAMELVRGRTLKQLIKTEGAIPYSRVAAICGQIARGLAHAHENGVIHRDLKPANVMLTEVHGGEVAKITDFGLARAEDRQTRLTRADQLLGTPAFMAPEQTKGTDEVGPPADVYALGGVMYALLAGRPPFGGKSLLVVLDKHRNEAPAPLADFGGLGPLALELLRKDPAERPTARQVVERLELLGVPGPLGPESTPTEVTEVSSATQPPLESVSISFTPSPAEAAAQVSARTSPARTSSARTSSALGVEAWTQGKWIAASLALLMLGLGASLWLMSDRPPTPAEVTIVSPEPTIPTGALLPPTVARAPQPSTELTPGVTTVAASGTKGSPESSPKDTPAKPTSDRAPLKPVAATGALSQSPRQRIERALTSRHLRLSDLADDDSVSSALQKLESAERTSSSAEIDLRTEDVIRSVSTARITPLLLKRRLGELSGRLDRVESRTSKEVFSPLESRFLDLRQQLGRVEGAELLLSIGQLESELSHLENDPSTTSR